MFSLRGRTRGRKLSVQHSHSLLWGRVTPQVCITFPVGSCCCGCRAVGWLRCAPGRAEPRVRRAAGGGPDVLGNWGAGSVCCPCLSSRTGVVTQKAPDVEDASRHVAFLSCFQDTLKGYHAPWTGQINSYVDVVETFLITLTLLGQGTN